MLSNHRTLLIVGTVYKIHSSKVSIIGYASCVRFDFLYIGAIFYDVNSLGGSLKLSGAVFGGLPSVTRTTHRSNAEQ